MAVKFRMVPTVYVSVANDDGDFPQLPTDPEGVVKRLWKWLVENDIGNNIRGGTSGPTTISGFYSREDAEKIQVFLESIGVEGDWE
jgi:hypothetical protein